ncbi:MAG: hypothetical protein KIS92_17535 [Planctomycetota bacterium]|nr:hypothetical protein [Planctomycetota bacterium]
MSDARHCWKCHADYPAETVVCVRCGVNLVTGADLAPKEDAEDPGPRGLVEHIADLTPGLLRPVVWIPALLLALGGWGVIGLGVVLAQSGAVLSGLPVAALGLILYAQSVVWMITGQFWLLHSALVEFQGRHWTIFVLGVFGPGLALLLALKFLAGHAVE